MSTGRLRLLTAGIFVGGIAGMIVGSIRDSNPTALTFGLLTVGAAVSLLAATAVASSAPGLSPVRFDEEHAAELEHRIGALVSAGADDVEVRELVRLAVDMGADAVRSRGASTGAVRT